MGLVQWLKSQFLCQLIICYGFLVSGLLINLLQICTLPLWPINKQLARKINCKLGYSLTSQSVAILEWWSGTEVTLYTDPESCRHYGKENAIVILNHNFEIDFLCGWSFCDRFGLLGSSKCLAKKELSYMPIIGWMWYFLEMVFIKRKWEEDETCFVQSLQNLRDYPEKFWFLIQCEGTRFTAEKHRISMEVAEKKGLPKLKHHILPRTKGFWVAVQKLRGTVAAVYCCTLNFRNGETPTLRGVISGTTYHPDIYIRRIPLGSVPEDETECSAWLHKLYQEKDKFQEDYIQTGRFPGPIVTAPRSPWTLINWLVWTSLLLYTLCLVLFQVVTSGSILTTLATVFLCFAVSFGVRRMIGETEIRKSSRYGVPVNNNN
ncbi:1-acyl-sn-glycerol-3-phosphate acyltransferase delta [Esox lucius]|uniref:1-acyl-sn-glycerol-3-phosphate acyltransferase delta n=1 Tax=Esox lucius TaxID=8010 RepID=A0AAY5K6Q3_ESOLU|nr:1-acyl-sn-glycerol-3-phosphate acyltransferase delta [Esox lucius]XP_010865637.1 1-acyl-sn-glycerol-3-phosphate acyltransferase delta [Esox lucius]